MIRLLCSTLVHTITMKSLGEWFWRRSPSSRQLACVYSILLLAKIYSCLMPFDLQALTPVYVLESGAALRPVRRAVASANTTNLILGTRSSGFGNGRFKRALAAQRQAFNFMLSTHCRSPAPKSHTTPATCRSHVESAYTST